MKETVAYHKTYDLTDWEGGIAVYVAEGEHGTIIVSIPRLKLSTVLMGKYDIQAITSMLMHNSTMYHDPRGMDTFANLIVRDIRNLK